MNKTTTELEITVSNEQIDDVWVKVEASKLSLEDEFMKHKPKTDAESKLKASIETVIKKGLKDFWRPKYDPSFYVDEEGRRSICYVVGNRPVVGKDYSWWKRNAEEFNPERKSRLGTKSEYIAFIAVLIKKMVEEGWKIETAWNAICNDSKKLGHYWNSENAKHQLEYTGCREVCGFFDLVNTFKILADDKNLFHGYWVASGYFKSTGDSTPLAYICYEEFRYNYNGCTGWIVCEEAA